MLGDLWNGLTAGLAKRWVRTVLAPAVVFWGVGLLLWAVDHGWEEAWRQVDAQVRGRPVPEQVALAVGVLLVVAGSGTAVERLTTPAVQLLEGYHWPVRLFDWRSRRHNSRVAAMERTWAELAAGLSGRGAAEQNRFILVDQRLRRYPDAPEHRMPTVLGNSLRAAEARPWHKYGLDPVKCWYAFWSVLPDNARTELAAARTRVDLAGTVWLWALLFAGWSAWNWWALPLSLAGMSLAYGWLVTYARQYGDLVEATFDVHRWALYAALHWPPPLTPETEREEGTRLTAYLWRGSHDPHPRFVDHSRAVSVAQEPPAEARRGTLWEKLGLLRRK
ncbi:hypothetical protein AB0O34_26160 [Sphaerisporangium sp. NPDC088356]|uniref:hypothetical protein n=1 Tax=Sphaerisporangium sp. NPDC088356 TaxID=3154871 RepID=UPI00342486A7